jgi:hypothetical protein
MKVTAVLIIGSILLLNSAVASLSVSVAEPEGIDVKAIVKLIVTNAFNAKVESARAVAFLMDEKGKVVGQSAQWVIGGSKDRPALEPKKVTSFFFVIPVDANSTSTGTNLTAKVTFLKVILEGGKSVDVSQNVTVTQKSK